MLVLLAACGNDRAYDCSTSPLTYETFGEPFVANWCTSCHSSNVPAAMRQDAPLDVNFDTRDEVHAQRARILATVEDGSMPPRGGPSDDERVLLRDWVGCGAP